VIAGIPFLLIMEITSNLSSAIIVMGIAVLMCFVADPKYKKYFVLLFVVLAIAAVAVIGVYMIAQGQEGTGNYRGDRVLAWLNPEAFSDDDGFQTLQALYAIGSGGIWGKGLGQSMQKLGFLPEAQNDMVFSIICEELGLFGAFCVIILFLMLIWRFMFIANNAPDLFGAMLVVGVMAHFAIQVILNIAVVTNTIPNTGITLPFISYGGTSVVFLLAEIGLVLNVAGQIQIQD
jgi:cell division protein FtsW